MKCPKCGSTNVARERRPNGDDKCFDCHHSWPSKDTPREHVSSPDCWCGPELIGDYTNEGGTKHYLHREVQ